MKASIHLFYGIIIGVLICACTGSIKSDKAEFKVEEIKFLAGFRTGSNEVMAKLKKEGWTIIDVQIVEDAINGTEYYAHVGK
tara:strand:+ start:131 stop:376 length:246 start_codon:yes stop_codon:yes gene_type:complete